MSSVRARKVHGLCTLAMLFGGLWLIPVQGRSCNSPLLLDLNGDGVRTTTGWYPVRFDFKGDGTFEASAWTAPDGEEGFLWLDLNANGRVDSGRELFGDATLLPTGEMSRHGFEALEVYDGRDMGGNADGSISEDDLIWRWLRLWVDSNHDGISQRTEIRNLQQEGIRSISLGFVKTLDYDSAGNLHLYQGIYVKRVVRRYGLPYLRTLAIHDVFFQELAP